MKIQTGYQQQQQPIAQHTIDNATEKTASAAVAPQNSAARQGKPQDIVDLSASLDGASKQQQTEQAKRVESIKSLVNAGKYQVDSRLVAEKMLSGFSRVQ